MLKKSFLAVFGLLRLRWRSRIPRKANAEVAIGVTIGGPGIRAPAVYPYGYAYVAPRPAYVYPRPYVYPGPIIYGRAYDRPYWRHEAFERHEYREHRDRDRLTAIGIPRSPQN